MRILRHRKTDRFIALLVGCGCGRQFLHRLDRPFVACLGCGAVGDMRRMLERLRNAELAAERAAAERVAEDVAEDVASAEREFAA